MPEASTVEGTRAGANAGKSGAQQPGLQVAQERTDQLIAQIQPGAQSEEQRLRIVSYVSSLVDACFAPSKVHAFPFGSVPLKTYLPDGDIDLSLVQANGPSVQQEWTDKLAQVLEREMVSKRSPYRVRDVQVIKAEVNLVKCLVDSIVVDISFQTLGGLCTVLFLEHVDRELKDDHLFKRSIILVKAWCYYESRLLGAHHGLISTYALEVLVLYIFNFYRNVCTSPLKVLAQFLKVFSTFDWDEHCLTLSGPVPLSQMSNSRPPATGKGSAVQMGGQGDGKNTSAPALTPSLAPSLMEMLRTQYSQEALNLAPQSKQFQPKHLNILDPLLASNNLGRSVSKASFARIRKALSHGAQVLTKVLEKLPAEAAVEIDHFFRNTWKAAQQRKAVSSAPSIASNGDKDVSPKNRAQSSESVEPAGPKPAGPQGPVGQPNGGSGSQGSRGYPMGHHKAALHPYASSAVLANGHAVGAVSGPQYGEGGPSLSPAPPPALTMDLVTRLLQSQQPVTPHMLQQVYRATGIVQGSQASLHHHQRASSSDGAQHPLVTGVHPQFPESHPHRSVPNMTHVSNSQSSVGMVPDAVTTQQQGAMEQGGRGHGPHASARAAVSMGLGAAHVNGAVRGQQGSIGDGRHAANSPLEPGTPPEARERKDAGSHELQGVMANAAAAAHEEPPRPSSVPQSQAAQPVQITQQQLLVMHTLQQRANAAMQGALQAHMMPSDGRSLQQDRWSEAERLQHAQRQQRELAAFLSQQGRSAGLGHPALPGGSMGTGLGPQNMASSSAALLQQQQAMVASSQMAYLQQSQHMLQLLQANGQADARGSGEGGSRSSSRVPAELQMLLRQQQERDALLRSGSSGSLQGLAQHLSGQGAGAMPAASAVPPLWHFDPALAQQYQQQLAAYNMSQQGAARSNTGRGQRGDSQGGGSSSPALAELMKSDLLSGQVDQLQTHLHIALAYLKDGSQGNSTPTGSAAAATAAATAGKQGNAPGARRLQPTTQQQPFATQQFGHTAGAQHEYNHAVGDRAQMGTSQQRHPQGYRSRGPAALQGGPFPPAYMQNVRGGYSGPNSPMGRMAQKMQAGLQERSGQFDFGGAQQARRGAGPGHPMPRNNSASQLAQFERNGFGVPGPGYGPYSSGGYPPPRAMHMFSPSDGAVPSFAAPMAHPAQQRQSNSVPTSPRLPQGAEPPITQALSQPIPPNLRVDAAALGRSQAGSSGPTSAAVPQPGPPTGPPPASRPTGANENSQLPGTSNGVVAPQTGTSAGLHPPVAMPNGRPSFLTVAAMPVLPIGGPMAQTDAARVPSYVRTARSYTEDRDQMYDGSADMRLERGPRSVRGSSLDSAMDGGGGRAEARGGSNHRSQQPQPHSSGVNVLPASQPSSSHGITFGASSDGGSGPEGPSRVDPGPIPVVTMPTELGRTHSGGQQFVLDKDFPVLGGVQATQAKEAPALRPTGDWSRPKAGSKGVPQSPVKS